MVDAFLEFPRGEHMHVQGMENVEEYSLHGPPAQLGALGRFPDDEQIKVAPLPRGADRVRPEDTDRQRSVLSGNAGRDARDVVW